MEEDCLSCRVYNIIRHILYICNLNVHGVNKGNDNDISELYIFTCSNVTQCLRKCPQSCALDKICFIL